MKLETARNRSIHEERKAEMGLFRRILFWIHLAVGISAALVILMMSATGIILTYEAQLNEWARRAYRSAEPGPNAKPLTADELIVRADRTEPDLTPSSIMLPADPLAPAIVSLGRGNTRYVDRYTGGIRGDGDTRTRRFLQAVRNWHRWFALEGDGRTIGRAVTGAANLGFLFLVLSGTYLWWPRSLSLKAFRNITWFRRGLSGKARDFNWHNVIGFWSAVPLVIIVFSGAMISYRWVGDLIYIAVGETPPSRSAPAAAGAETGTETEPPAPPPAGRVSYQKLADAAAVEVPGWRSIQISIPEDPHAPIPLRADTGSGRQPAHWTNLAYDAASGAKLSRSTGQESRGQAARSWLRFAHTGEVYGVIGQTIAGIVTTGTVVLAWTGLAMLWRRFVRWRARRREPSSRSAAASTRASIA